MQPDHSPRSGIKLESVAHLAPARSLPAEDGGDCEPRLFVPCFLRDSSSPDSRTPRCCCVATFWLRARGRTRRRGGVESTVRKWRSRRRERESRGRFRPAERCDRDLYVVGNMSRVVRAAVRSSRHSRWDDRTETRAVFSNRKWSVSRQET